LMFISQKLSLTSTNKNPMCFLMMLEDESKADERKVRDERGERRKNSVLWKDCDLLHSQG
jgi:hypothetical protein